MNCEIYTPSNCEDFDSIKSCFSPHAKTQYRDGKYYCMYTLNMVYFFIYLYYSIVSSGTLEDIVRWCIIHSQSKSMFILMYIIIVF